MKSQPRIYLDHAATSWPKPEAVYLAVNDAMRTLGAAAGRGAYAESLRADQVINQLRRQIATLVNAPNASGVVFAANGTAALNVAISGLFGSLHSPVPHVVTTAAEHNSVLRPLRAMADHQRVEMTIVPCDSEGKVDADQVLAAVGKETRLVAVGHASNVTAAIQPIAAIGSGLRDHPALFLVDAAQTFGYLPIDVQEAGIDLLATAGHKGALGPLGTGALCISPQAEPQIAASVWGGTGGNSDQLTMPTCLPQRLEAGNLNVPALAGWLAGLQWLQQNQDSQQHLRQLAQRFDQGLAEIEGIQVWGTGSPLPVRSFVSQQLSPSDFAAVLEAEFGVQVRTGLHCAALIHPHLGTASDGTVRLSAGHLSRSEEVDLAINAIAQIVAGL